MNTNWQLTRGLTRSARCSQQYTSFVKDALRTAATLRLNLLELGPYAAPTVHSYIEGLAGGFGDPFQYIDRFPYAPLCIKARDYGTTNRNLKGALHMLARCHQACHHRVTRTA